ncbi:MAG TPA: glycine zipper domain-containing protein [Trinickia sp.]|jgi:outer membrane lipoprotein SlyB|nr:glycine zipper domain-containing protein [Trinickia sp.]
MSLIVAGRFTTFAVAEAAARQLFAEGFVEEDVNLFFVNPRGQHAHLAADTLRSVSFTPRPPKHPARGAVLGAVAGAVAGVALFAAVSGSVIVAVLAAGVGAYVGSMIGATIEARMRASPPLDEVVHHAVHHEVRESGVLVAVHVSPESQSRAAQVLAQAGGQAIERATGRWQHGRWADFDPTKPPMPLAEAPQAQHREA